MFKFTGITGKFIIHYESLRFIIEKKFQFYSIITKPCFPNIIIENEKRPLRFRAQLSEQVISWGGNH